METLSDTHPAAVTETLDTACSDIKVIAPAASFTAVIIIPATPMNEAIHSILSTAEHNAVATHLLGNRISKLLGKYAYRAELRGRKLFDYLLSQKWLSVSDDKSVVTLPSTISLKFAYVGLDDDCSELVAAIEKLACATSDEKTEHKEKKPSKTSIKEINKIGDIFINCPHCGNTIVVAKRAIRCGIFRHGVFKSNGRPIKPHGSQEYCETLLRTDKIYGCGQPFRICKEQSTEVWTYTAEECGWI